MAKIISARAYANNEVAYLAWTMDGVIDDCLGFDITRIYDDGEERHLAVWVPFKGQSNPKWLPQDTRVWPIQKLVWRDLTVRRKRDAAELRPTDVTIKYRIRPVMKATQGSEIKDADMPKKEYDGDKFPLKYAGDAIETNKVTVTSRHGNVRAAFTNGILSAQWLKHALEENGETMSVQSVRAHMLEKGDKIRTYLTGDVLGLLREMLDRVGQEPGAEVRMALYELGDAELVDAIIKNKSQVRVILSNSSKERGGDAWDAGNSKFRAKLESTAGLKLFNRMFNNNHIGHNKFAVYFGADKKPKAVMTGSTNWTPTGLCGQSNNAVIIDSPELAKQYSDEWDRLLTDTDSFDVPNPLSLGTSNHQGADLRTFNATGCKEVTLADKTRITAWYAPCTKATTKGKELPPDLAAVYSIMRKANNCILFACFMPSRQGKTSIIEEAISLGMKDNSLLVYGSVSDPTAMPNYIPPEHGGAENGDDDDHGEKKPQPAIFDNDNVHVCRAAALTKLDIVGQFEAEMLKVGNAIIHDKIVVVDPLSKETGAVILGSHNLGYKASYENDENLVIIRNNPSLIQAYMVHVLDVYEHYRFRAAQQQARRDGKKRWDGFLSTDSKWLDAYVNTPWGDLSRYLGAK